MDDAQTPARTKALAKTDKYGLDMTAFILTRGTPFGRSL
jgi:hypothetical protein